MSDFELWVWRGVLIALASACITLAIDVFLGLVPGSAVAIAFEVFNPF